jgi:hypothetical protein
MMIHMIELEGCLLSETIDLNMYGSLLPRKDPTTDQSRVPSVLTWCNADR